MKHCRSKEKYFVCHGRIGPGMEYISEIVNFPSIWSPREQDNNNKITLITERVLIQRRYSTSPTIVGVLIMTTQSLLKVIITFPSFNAQMFIKGLI